MTQGKRSESAPAARDVEGKPRPTLVLRGKWATPAVPHHGWLNVGVEDLGERRTTCEMCEFQQIRFAHTMRHRGYADILVVGCECAGFMSGDPESAEQRDREMRNRANRLRSYLTKGWQVAGPSAITRRLDGIEITVREHPELGWAATVLDTRTYKRTDSKRSYASSDELMIATFEVAERIRLRRAAAREKRTEAPTTAKAQRPAPPRSSARHRQPAAETEEDRVRRETEQRIGMRLVHGRLRPL